MSLTPMSFALNSTYLPRRPQDQFLFNPFHFPEIIQIEIPLLDFSRSKEILWSGNSQFPNSRYTIVNPLSLDDSNIYNRQDLVNLQNCSIFLGNSKAKLLPNLTSHNHSQMNIQGNNDIDYLQGMQTSIKSNSHQSKEASNPTISIDISSNLNIIGSRNVKDKSIETENRIPGYQNNKDQGKMDSNNGNLSNWQEDLSNNNFHPSNLSFSSGVRKGLNGGKRKRAKKITKPSKSKVNGSNQYYHQSQTKKGQRKHRSPKNSSKKVKKSTNNNLNLLQETYHYSHP